METNVFKFGGASVNSAEGVQNVATILAKYPRENVVMVISAMGKTTNALEELLQHYLSFDAVSMVEAFYKVRDFHFEVLHKLFCDKKQPVYKALETEFVLLQGYLRKGHLHAAKIKDYNFEYDQVVSFGEKFASLIMHHYLVFCGMKSKLFDAQKIIRTDSSFRDARVDWPATSRKIRSSMNAWFSRGNETRKVAVTQGFIGSDTSGNTTTLGREGSDFSAAILAYAMKTKEVTIWKDVPGVMNADPKWFRNAKKIDVLSFREAIELAYFGASVIHPKTIKPLENANIILKVKSFLHPELPGTAVKSIKKWSVPFPIFIRKQKQVLVSLSARDFSFIIEENLSEIFSILAKHQIRVNMMQNSAISFSICVDDDPALENKCLAELQKDYLVRYNKNLELFTIRHYQQRDVDKIMKGKKLLMEQKTRSTVHLVVSAS